MRACSYASVAFSAIALTVLSFSACAGAPAATSPAVPAPSTPPIGAASAGSATTPVAAPVTTAEPAATAPAATGSSTTAVALPPASATPFRNADADAGGPDRSLADIRTIVAANRDAFRGCYDKALKDHSDLKGSFVLHFVLSPDGSVKAADADPQKSEIHEPGMTSCAVSALKALKFPPSKKGMETTVNYPFDFKPGARPAGSSR